MTAFRWEDTQNFHMQGNNAVTKQALVDMLLYIHNTIIKSGWEYIEDATVENSDLLNQMNPEASFASQTRSQRIYKLDYQFKEDFPFYMEIHYQECHNFRDPYSPYIITPKKFSTAYDPLTKTLINPTSYYYGATQYSSRAALSNSLIPLNTQLHNSLEEDGFYYLFMYSPSFTMAHSNISSENSKVSFFNLILQLDLDNAGNPQSTGITVSAGGGGDYQILNSLSESPLVRLTAEPNINSYSGWGARVGPHISNRVNGMTILQPMYFFQPHMTKFERLYTCYFTDFADEHRFTLEYAPGKVGDFIVLPQISYNVSSNHNSGAKLILPLYGEMLV